MQWTRGRSGYGELARMRPSSSREQMQRPRSPSVETLATSVAKCIESLGATPDPFHCDLARPGGGGVRYRFVWTLSQTFFAEPGAGSPPKNALVAVNVPETIRSAYCDDVLVP